MLMKKDEEVAWGRGVYGFAEASRLINFAAPHDVSRQTISRWVRGYDFVVEGVTHHSSALWSPDYPANDDHPLELSFRDVIELRFVRAFRNAGVSLATVRTCFNRAVTLVGDERPFSSRTFRTDGRSIFLDITEDSEDAALIDLRHRQSVFRTFVAQSLKELEFDAGAVARWFPLGDKRRSVVVDPSFALGRPITSMGRVPTETIASAVDFEGSVDRVASLYEIPVSAVRDAIAFETKLAA